MKFKNSKVLLISLISIFLLLSISAVSAADIDDSANLVTNDAGLNEINDNYIKTTNHLLSDDNNDSVDTNTSDVDTNSSADTNTNNTNSTSSDSDDTNSSADNNATNSTNTANNTNVTVNSTITVSNTTDVNVHDMIANISVTIKDTGNKTVSYTKDNLTVILDYIDDEGKNVSSVITDYELNNRRITFVTESLNNATVTIIYLNGTEDELKAVTNLRSTRNIAVIPVNTTVTYQSGNFTFKVIDNDTGDAVANTNVTISGIYYYVFGNGTSLSTSKTFTSDANGIITLLNLNISKSLDTTAIVYNYSTLEVGSFNLTVSANDGNKLVGNNTVVVTVNQVNAVINASNFKKQVGSSTRYTFTIYNKATGQLLKFARLQFKIKLNSSGYTTYNATTNGSGQAGFNLNLYGGTYPVVISCIDSNIKASSVSRNVTITKKPAVLSASNRVILYNSAPTAIITIKDKSTGKVVKNAVIKVRLYTTSKKYVDYAFVSNSKGVVSFNAALTVGKHKMVISTLDNNYTASSITRYTTLKKTTGKFSAPKVTTYYKSGKAFSIKLTNSKNKAAMYGSKVGIRVYVSSSKYYKYTGVTNGSGIVSLKTGSLKPGTYKVVVSSADSGYTAKAVTSQIKVTKVPTKLTPTAFKAKYNAGKYFKVKVTHKTNKKVLSGVKLTVKVYTSAKKYTTYTIKSNSKGIASLKVTQKVGTYKVVVSSANSYYTASTAKSTITVTKA